LKKYSNISNDFIDEFLSFYDIETKYNDFVIDIEKIAKWLKTKKGRIKETLENSYKINIDYIIYKNENKEKKEGEYNKNIILLTPECFKKICQLTRTKKGNEVREYFIELENILNDYKTYIINGLQKRIQELENNQKPYIENKKGIIYIFRVSDKENDTLYKIGKTNNLKNRMKQHNSSNSDNIDILYILETDNIDSVEKCIKLAMKEYQYRKYKEVYQVNINLLKSVIKDCKKLMFKYKKNDISKEHFRENLYAFIEH
jgi:phage anti-repressor protein